MGDDATTFGRAVGQFRKERGWSLIHLASQIVRENGKTISPQYLNDIEHDRRRPSSDHMIRQFADILGVDVDWLYYLTNQYPADLFRGGFSEEEFKKRMVAFRRAAPETGEDA